MKNTYSKTILMLVILISICLSLLGCDDDDDSSTYGAVEITNPIEPTANFGNQIAMKKA